MPPAPELDRFTALLDGEGLLMSALHELPAPMWMTDRLGHVRWLNGAAGTLLGPALGRHFSGYLEADGAAEAREMFARKLQGSLDSTVQRTMLSTPAGSVPAELTSVPVRDGGDVVGVIVLIRDGVPATASRRRPKPRLTPRQHEVLELLAHGRSTSEIARLLDLSEETVRNHVRHLLAELRVKTRLEAVVAAFRNDWL